MLGTLNISVSPSDGDPSVLVVNLSGELDGSTLPDLEEQLIPKIKDKSNKAFIFNLKGLKFMDSKSIGFFVYAYTTLSRTQREIAITEYNRTIKDILTIVGLVKIISCYPTLNEAMKKMELTSTLHS